MLLLGGVVRTRGHRRYTLVVRRASAADQPAFLVSIACKGTPADSGNSTEYRRIIEWRRR